MPLPDLRIGISGWRYAPWRGDFYPEKLPQKQELAFASRAVNSIEINGSFYALQTPQRYAQWAADAPEDFRFSVKAPRYITHVKRLHEVATPMANFFASGPLHLGAKLGPFLWQLPPSLSFDAQRIAAFLERLPHDSEQARHCARDCDSELRVSGYLDVERGQPLRHAIEVRHPSFCQPAFVKLLRKHKVALVFADSAGKWPYAEDLTSDFVYLRLHGNARLYESGYDEQALKHWQARIATWSQGEQVADAQLIDEAHRGRPRAARDVYCYFDNDLKVRAPYDAYRLLQKFDLAAALPNVPGRSPGVSS